MPFIRSISGLRATLSDASLSQSVVESYARAFANYLPTGEIVIGRDGRPSGEWIENLIANSLRDAGRNVRLLGIVPTPTVQLETEHSDAAGGIAITASHNPIDWNGMKFINSSGVFLDANENKAFWKIVDTNDYPKKPETIGQIIRDNDAIDRHIAKICDIDMIANNIENIRSLKLKVAVDAVNASGSVAIPKLLAKLGCQVVPLFCSSDGIFPHEPEPLPKNLTELAEAVKLHNCDLGIAVDPDADRLVLVDGNGNAVNEEMTLALAIDAVLSTAEANQIAVINLSTSKLSETIANAKKGKVYRSAVGEINVVKIMKKYDAIIGGEGSGGVILPACHYGRDSLVGTALVLLLLAERKANIQDIIHNYPKYSMIKHKQAFAGDFSKIKHKLTSLFGDAEIDETDGIRFDYENSWLQMRLSNTEPIIRIIAESPSFDQSNSLLEKALKEIL